MKSLSTDWLHLDCTI